MNDWSLAEQHAERAWRHYEAGRWDHALRLLRRALSIQPEQVEWLFGLGLTLDALRRYEQAVDAYQKVLDINPDNTEALLHRASCLLRLDRPAEALDALDRAHAIDPTLHAVQCHRIAAHAQLGDHHQAEVAFYLSQQDEPECPACFDHIAHSLAIRGEYRRAVWCWGRTLELEPAHPQARANQARAYWYQGELDSARSAFEQHLSENHDDQQATLEFASLLIETNELQPAQDCLSAFLKQQPEHAPAYHLLGDLHIKQNNPIAAVNAYRSAMQHQPKRPGVELGLAIAADLMADPKARAQHLINELHNPGQDARQVLELGRQLLNAKMPEQAIALLSPMIDGFDDLFVNDDLSLAEALRLRGLAMQTGGKHEQVIADCREAVRLNPRLTGAWTQLAYTYEETGQPQRALVCIQHAIELDPEDADLRKHASRLKRQALTKAAVRTIRRAA